MQHYLSSPRSVMLETYNNLVEENRNVYSENDLKIIRQTLERLSPELEYVLFSREKVLISTIPEITKSDIINQGDTSELGNIYHNIYINNIINNYKTQNMEI